MGKFVSGISAFGLAAIVLLSGLATGCSSDRSVLSPREELLGIDESEIREFHSTLYFPKGVALRYPGYVIGLQKANRGRIAAPDSLDDPDRSFLRNDVAYFNQEAPNDLGWGLGTRDHVMHKLRNDPKAFFITHVTSHWISTKGFPLADECFLYNALRSPALNESDGNDLSSGLAWKSCSRRFEDEKAGIAVPKWGEELKDREFYTNGIVALKTLESAIARDLGQVSIVRDATGNEVRKNTYTHVLLIVMGWNTAQQEAVRNMNDLAGNIMAAAEEAQAKGAKGEFRPLVVGLTWPSYWSTSILNAFSYANKANDADEIGLSWLNLVMNHTLPNATGGKTPIIVIGHSFGARAASRALFSAPALRIGRNDPERPVGQSKVDLFAGLEGAFSINRFKQGRHEREFGAEGAPYRDFAKLPGRIMLTQSKWDAAAGGPVFWYDPAGSHASYQKACQKQKPWQDGDVFWCMTAAERPAVNGTAKLEYPKSSFNLCGPDGKCLCPSAAKEACTGTENVGGLTAPPRDRVVYVDVSEHITQYNSPGSGGVAHSDIYRLSTGRLIWAMLNLP